MAKRSKRKNKHISNDYVINDEKSVLSKKPKLSDPQEPELATTQTHKRKVIKVNCPAFDRFRNIDSILDSLGDDNPQSHTMTTAIGSLEVKKRLSSVPKESPQESNKKPIKGSKSSFLEKMNAKLEGGRFRYINEVLYTSDGKSAFEMFQEDPSLFDAYHEGYRSQVEKWPENPLDIFIEILKLKPKSWQVGDFGCGEAKLAQRVSQNVYSFDLVSRNEFITACDISKVPLKDGSLDVAIFCLSLMGTNFVEFLKEAKRTLKINGTLMIAEVKSRFDNIKSFIDLLTKLGFKLILKDESNKMFVLFEFVNTPEKGEVSSFHLKACKYKRR